MTRVKTTMQSGRRARDAEVQRLLASLEDGSVVTRRGNGFVHVGLNPAQQGTRLPRRLVEICLVQDWLERRGSDLVLSDTGRARLRRSKAEDDAFRQQHQLRASGEREIGGARRAVLLNEAESPLGWLKSRRDRNGNPLISESQYEAGERLRADYWFAHLSPRVTSNWSFLAPQERRHRSAPTDVAALRDNVLAAKERVMRALMAVGPELSGVLVDICCELKGLEEAEKANGWPQRAGKVVLQIALTRLARHYGLTQDESQRSRRGGLRHWGSEDYRPTLDSWREDQGGSRP